MDCSPQPSVRVRKGDFGTSLVKGGLTMSATRETVGMGEGLLLGCWELGLVGGDGIASSFNYLPRHSMLVIIYYLFMISSLHFSSCCHGCNLIPKINLRFACTARRLLCLHEYNLAWALDRLIGPSNLVA